MLVYWLIFIAALLCFLLSKEEHRSNSILFLILIGVEIFIGGFRDISVGVDTWNYQRVFHLITQGDVLNLNNDPVCKKDTLFWTLFGYLYLHFKDLVFLIQTFLHWAIVYFAIKKMSANIFLSLLIYISFRFSDAHLNLMRQGLSLALVLYSYKYVIDKDFKKYIFMILIAFLLHKSAIMVFPIYFLHKFDFRKIHIFYILLIIAAFYVLKHQIYSNLFYIFLQNDTYNVYLKHTNEHGILYYILYIVTYLICLFGGDRNDSETNRLLCLTLIGVTIQSITLVNPAFNRVSCYYTQFFIFLIPNVYTYCCTAKYGKGLPILFVTGFLLLLYILGGPAPGIVPYKFCWE